MSFQNRSYSPNFLFIEFIPSVKAKTNPNKDNTGPDPEYTPYGFPTKQDIVWTMFYSGQSSTLYLDYCTIQDAYIGIYCDHSWLIFRQNTVIRCFNGISLSSFADAWILSNTFIGCCIAMYVNTSNTKIDNNIIQWSEDSITHGALNGWKNDIHGIRLEAYIKSSIVNLYFKDFNNHTGDYHSILSHSSIGVFAFRNGLHLQNSLIHKGPAKSNSVTLFQNTNTINDNRSVYYWIVG